MNILWQDKYIHQKCFLIMLVCWLCWILVFWKDPKQVWKFSKLWLQITSMTPRNSLTVKQSFQNVREQLLYQTPFGATTFSYDVIWYIGDHLLLLIIGHDIQYITHSVHHICSDSLRSCTESGQASTVTAAVMNEYRFMNWWYIWSTGFLKSCNNTCSTTVQ